MSELQARHCVTPEQGTWLLCSLTGKQTVITGKQTVISRIKLINFN